MNNVLIKLRSVLQVTLISSIYLITFSNNINLFMEVGYLLNCLSSLNSSKSVIALIFYYNLFLYFLNFVYSGMFYVLLYETKTYISISLKNISITNENFPLSKAWNMY